MALFDSIKRMLTGQPVLVGEEQAAKLHEGWAQREESFYPALFGNPEGEQTLISEDIFKREFKRNRIHPFWLHHGVFTFAPTDARGSWLFATSGLSNAFDGEPDVWSGLGVEYILEAPYCADWAKAKLMRIMAYNLLITVGHYEGEADLTFGSTVALEGPVDDAGSKLTHFIALKPATVKPEFELVTGKVELLQMVAITAREADYASQNGHAALRDKLIEQTGGLLCDPDRDGVV